MSAGTTTGLSELYEPIRFDHFTFATIASPQKIGVPFAVTLTAIDNYGNPIAITGNVTLADTTGSIAFSNQSSRTFNVSITQANFSVKISATYADTTSQSNAFAVNQQSEWKIYLPLVTR